MFNSQGRQPKEARLVAECKAYVQLEINDIFTCFSTAACNKGATQWIALGVVRCLPKKYAGPLTPPPRLCCADESRTSAQHRPHSGMCEVPAARFRRSSTHQRRKLCLQAGNDAQHCVY
jgi:hypothetical protein